MGNRSRLALAVAVVLGLAIGSAAQAARTVKYQILCKGGSAGDPSISSTDSIVWAPATVAPQGFVAGVTSPTYSVADSTATPSIYVGGALSVVFEWSGAKTASTLANTAPMLELSNDGFQTLIQSPTGASDNIFINGETTTNVGIRRTAIMASQPNTSTGAQIGPIHWKYARLRFGATTAAADTLNVSATAYYGDDSAYDPPRPIYITTADKTIGTCSVSAGDTSNVHIGAMIYEQYGNNVVADRTYIVSRLGLVLTLSQVLAINCNRYPVYQGW